jgi:hypothetical protein
MPHDKKVIPETTEEKEKIIADFLEYLARDDEEILASAKDLAGVVDILRKVYISNGLIDRLVEKGKGFIAELEDPRVCWCYLKKLENSAQPALKDLEDALNIKASKLVSAVGDKNVPNWFWELLQDPKEVPSGSKEIFRRKAEKIQVSFGFTGRPVRSTNSPGKHPYKKGGPMGDGHPCKKY